jgi:RNA polymerase sigma-70 factor (ECF subfamily)
MPPHRRHVFILIKINGFSYKEAAAHLNIAVSTVEKHMHEAHKFLSRARAGLERPVSL